MSPGNDKLIEDLVRFEERAQKHPLVIWASVIFSIHYFFCIMSFIICHLKEFALDNETNIDHIIYFSFYDSWIKGVIRYVSNTTIIKIRINRIDSIDNDKSFGKEIK